jgi:membrane-associated phospholipid phosphatase
MNKKLLTISLIFLVLFFLVAMNLGIYSGLDARINSYFSNNQAGWLIDISKATGWILEPVNLVVISIIISIILFFAKVKKDALFFSLLMILGGGAIYLVKDIVARVRPENMLVPESGYSFPSGHALISVIFFGFFIYLTWKNVKNKPLKISLLTLLIILIVFTGISRLILGVHWASDVIGGWMLGLALVFLMIAIDSMLLRH